MDMTLKHSVKRWLSVQGGRKRRIMVIEFFCHKCVFCSVLIRQAKDLSSCPACKTRLVIQKTN